LLIWVRWRLQDRVLAGKLGFQHRLIRERVIEGVLVVLHVGDRHLLLPQQRRDLAALDAKRGRSLDHVGSLLAEIVDEAPI